MNIILIVIGIIVLAMVMFIIYRSITVKKQNIAINRKRFERIKPLYDQLENGDNLTQQDVYKYAKDKKTRDAAYQLLKDYNKSDVFPSEFYTIISAAESSLTNWLEFPTELDAVPDEIEHVKRVTIDFGGQHEQKTFFHYEVFKFRINETHWAAKNGWMLGVVGPYFDDSNPYDHTGAFSRLSSRSETTLPEEEAKWIHENITLRG